MAAKKKKPITVQYDGRNWKVKDGLAAEIINTLAKEKVFSEPKPRLASPNELANDPKVKIVVAVAESPIYKVIDYKLESGDVTKLATKKLECGRAGAQAAHAVSKVKLAYIQELCQGKPEDAYGLIGHVAGCKVTTIVVKARDSEELRHLQMLGNRKGMLSTSFYDENPQFYGPVVGGQVLTAVAFGPYLPDAFYGVTDYLPLWKCLCDVVS